MEITLLKILKIIPSIFWLIERERELLNSKIDYFYPIDNNLPIYTINQLNNQLKFNFMSV